MRSLLPLLSLLAACDPEAGLTRYNSDPEAQITTPSDGASVLAGTVVSMRGAASDPNHAMGELTATWFMGDVEACPSAAPAEDGTTTCEAVAPAADVELRLEVRDPEGAVGSAHVGIVVLPNGVPSATIESPEASGIYYADALITF